MPGAAVAAALALLLWACSAGGVLAHAVLVSSSPADGARLAEAPGEITLHFNEPVVLTALRLIGPGGTSVAGLDEVEVTGAEVRLALPSELPRGGYILSWRLTSIDGHPVAGALTFGIGADAQALEWSAEGVRLLAWMNRTVHYTALLAAAGGAFFLLLVQRRPAPGELRRGLTGLAAVAIVTLLLSAGLGGLDLTGASGLSLLTATPWAAAARTSLLPSAIAGLAGLLVLIAGLRLGNPTASRVLLGTGALVALTSLVLTGHAATASPRLLSTPAVYLHGVAAAFWIGSLWPLWVLLRRAPPAEVERIVRRFSRAAVASVLVLIVAGTALSVVQVEAPPALATTDYGRTLLVKLGLVVLLLGLAVLNRQVLTPRLASGSVRGLRSSIAAEMLLGLAILTATAFLGQTPPPRALATEDGYLAPHNHVPGARPWSGEVVAGDRRLWIEVHPAQAGENHVLIEDPTRADEDVGQEASMRWSLPAEGLEGLERPLDAEGRGVINLPLPGDWQLRIDVLVSDFEKAVFEAMVPVQP